MLSRRIAFLTLFALNFIALLILKHSDINLGLPIDYNWTSSDQLETQSHDSFFDEAIRNKLIQQEKTCFLDWWKFEDTNSYLNISEDKVLHYNGYYNRLFVFPHGIEGEENEWNLGFLWGSRALPKAMRDRGYCTFDDDIFRYRIYWTWCATGHHQIMRCKIPEEFRKKRPLKVTFIQEDGLRRSMILSTPVPPEEPKYRMAAYIRMNESEFPYIGEWLEWQKLMGVEHVWLYDNSATLEASIHVEPWLREGFVTIIPWLIPKMEKKGQMMAEMHAIYRFGKTQTKWLLMSDGDEFAYPIEHDTYLPALTNVQALSNKSLAGIQIESMMFAMKRRPGEDLVTSRHCWRANDTVHRWREKNFIIPRNVIHFSVHQIMDRNGTVHVMNPKLMRLNHYFGRDSPKKRPEWRYQAVDVYDSSLPTRFGNELKSRLEKMRSKT